MRVADVVARRGSSAQHRNKERRHRAAAEKDILSHCFRHGFAVAVVERVLWMPFPVPSRSGAIWELKRYPAICSGLQPARACPAARGAPTPAPSVCPTPPVWVWGFGTMSVDYQMTVTTSTTPSPPPDTDIDPRRYMLL